MTQADNSQTARAEESQVEGAQADDPGMTQAEGNPRGSGRALETAV
jgi:hypothetical protein